MGRDMTDGTFPSPFDKRYRSSGHPPRPGKVEPPPMPPRPDASHDEAQDVRIDMLAAQMDRHLDGCERQGEAVWGAIKAMDRRVWVLIVMMAAVLGAEIGILEILKEALP